MIQSIDTQLLLALNGHHTEWLDTFAWLFTNRWVWVPLYLSIFAVLVKGWGWKRALGLTVAIGACVALADQVCASVLRPIFARPRPTNPLSGISELVTTVNDYRGGRYGFPSCHAANSFALAVASSLIIKNWRYTAVIFTWAVLNCLTRPYLGVHYPGDLIVGAILGSLIALCVILPLRKRIPAPAESAPPYPAITFAVTILVIAVIAA